jgi:type IV pilus assembly protein PilV
MSARPSKSLRRRLYQRARLVVVAGYTVVEVMMALAVLSIGATGVIAMQKASLIGNMRARNLATANAIAMGWLDRLRMDGLRWRLLQNGLDTVGSDTAWLNVVGTDFPAIVGQEGQWFVPTPVVNNALPFVEVGSDVRGHDDPNPANHGFCTAIKVTQLLPNMIRAEVRVYWLRHQGRGVSGGGALCQIGAGYQTLLNAPLADESYHFVHLTSAILRNDI